MTAVDPWSNVSRPAIRATAAAGTGKPAPKSKANAPTNTTAAGSATAAQNADAVAYLRQELDQYGLGSLADWAWQTYTSAGNDALGKQLVTDELPNQAAFKARFPAIAIQQQKGEQVFSPTDYLNYENQVRSAFIQFGLPLPTTGAQFNDIITGLAGNGVSAAEVVNTRIPSAFARVINAPPEVLQAAEGMFGANSKSTLAAAFLNPNLDTNTIEQTSKAAEVQGTAQRFGIDINADRARHLTALGADSNLGQFQQLALERPLFDAQPGQTGQATMDQGIAGAFGEDATSQAAVERALQQRKALFAGGGEPYTSSSLSATPGIPGLGAGPT